MTASVPSQDPTAVVGRRFGAYVVDMVVVLAIVPWAIFLATANLTEYTEGPPCAALERVGEITSSQFCSDSNFTTSNTADGVEHSTVVLDRSAVYYSVGFALGYLVLVMWVLQAFTGATLGKALFGIRTVAEAGGPPGLLGQLLRGLLWILDGLLICGFPLIAMVTIIISKGHRRVGDMVASTYVVRSTDRGHPVVLPGPAGARGFEPGRPAEAYPATQTHTHVGPAATATIAAETVTSRPVADAGSSSHADATVQAAAPASSDDEPGPTAPGPTTLDRTPPPAAAAPPSAEGPRWDAARNAYIFWDASRQAWLVHDSASGEWKPID